MVEKRDVERFLSSFKVKMQLFNIIYRDDRGKNLQALADLEITPQMRTGIIKSIEVIDFSEKLVDTLYNLGDMWVFGKNVKGREVYIKISYGIPNSSTICISFHIAGKQMLYPFKENQL